MNTYLLIVATLICMVSAVPVALASDQQPAVLAVNEPGASAKTSAAAAPSAPSAPVVSWVDDTKPQRAVILCIHGLGLHKGTFKQFGEKMASLGFPTYAVDVRGFGEWKVPAKRTIDFDGALADIKQELLLLRKTYPGKPVIVLGESMGGAIALRATAMYPDLVSGLVSAVPAGDRFNQTKGKLEVGLHVVLGGFNKPMNVQKVVVDHATKKEDLRDAWTADPLARMQLTPRELMEFQGFMQKNFAYAKDIKDKPVLFIQGANDKLVRPAGTWQLCESLTTPDRQLVLSKTAEHLIFEEGQFSAEDIAFVDHWINKNVAAPKIAIKKNVADAPALVDKTLAPLAQNSADDADHKNSAAVKLASVSSASDDQVQPKISYWIELYRNGKFSTAITKTPFNQVMRSDSTSFPASMATRMC